MAFVEAFQSAFLYLAAALVAVMLGKRAGLGSVLGYLIVGALIGPWVLGLVGEEGERVTHFAEFGVVVMLFLIGLELEPQKLWRMRREVMGLGAAQVVLSALGIAGVAVLAGLEWKAALALGLIFAPSSTAIVLQTLTERRLLRGEAGSSSFAVLLFQDIAVIPMLALLPLLGSGDAHSGSGGHGAGAWVEAFPQWAQPLFMLAAVALVVFCGRPGLRPFLQAIAKTGQREAFTAAALLLVIGVALLMTKVGLSPALGAFVAGVVLAGSEYRHELESDLEPFKGLLLGLFFMGVGAGIDFGYVMANLGLVLVCALGLIALKAVVLLVLARLRGLSGGASILFSSALAAGGEFAFVLIAVAGPAGAIGEEISRLAVAVVALSMAATPLLILAALAWNRSYERKKVGEESERESDVEAEGHPVIICGFGRFGHAVGRLLRQRGFGCTVLEHDADQVDTLRRFGVAVHYGDAARPDLLKAAGAAEAKVLVIAVRETFVAKRIIETARKHFSHLKIFVRAFGRVEAYEILETGEDRIYRDTLDSSLEMSVGIMRALNCPESEARRAAKLYRERDETLLREMARHRHDEKEYASRAREANQAFDELMRVDREKREKERE